MNAGSYFESTDEIAARLTMFLTLLDLFTNCTGLSKPSIIGPIIFALLNFDKSKTLILAEFKSGHTNRFGAFERLAKE